MLELNFWKNWKLKKPKKTKPLNPHLAECVAQVKVVNKELEQGIISQKEHDETMKTLMSVIKSSLSQGGKP